MRALFFAAKANQADGRLLDQYVIPGNIIFKQRGTTWHPGENAIRGRDHTIHASVAGYVKYYRDPERHPNKQFIGVAFEKTDTLPYPKNEPRRRKLGFVAVVRKTHDKKTSNITASGIPKSVTRKGGLYDIEKLEKETWTRDKVEQLRQARRVSKLAAKSPKPEETAAVSTTPSAGSTEAGEASSTEAGETVAGKKKGTRAQQQREFVHPLAFIQKRWLERRRTRKLHLNPRTYSYSESNASIGRLVSRTMYTAPWKLGGRKSRFRAKRRRREERTKQLIADRELVRAEKEKERIAEEKKRAERLAKQRAKGAGKAAGKKAGKEEKPLAA